MYVFTQIWLPFSVLIVMLTSVLFMFIYQVQCLSGACASWEKGVLWGQDCPGCGWCRARKWWCVELGWPQEPRHYRDHADLHWLQSRLERKKTRVLLSVFSLLQLSPFISIFITCICVRNHRKFEWWLLYFISADGTCVGGPTQQSRDGSSYCT